MNLFRYASSEVSRRICNTLKEGLRSFSRYDLYESDCYFYLYCSLLDRPIRSRELRQPRRKVSYSTSQLRIFVKKDKRFESLVRFTHLRLAFRRYRYLRRRKSAIRRLKGWFMRWFFFFRWLLSMVPIPNLSSPPFTRNQQRAEERVREPLHVPVSTPEGPVLAPDIRAACREPRASGGVELPTPSASPHDQIDTNVDATTTGLLNSETPEEIEKAYMAFFDHIAFRNGWRTLPV